MKDSRSTNLENGRFHTRRVTKQIGIWTWKRFFKTSPQRFGFKQPTQKNQMLLLFTYLSGLIGAGLLTAIVFRQYSRMSRRAQGVEDIKIGHYGRRPHLFRYRGYVYPDYVINDLRSIHQFDSREDDVWVVSFPKSGTTWLQEIVYLVHNGVDTEKAASGNIEERFPFFEWIYPGIKTLNNMASPRLLKTHLPLSMLPNDVKKKKPKILYIARNPKDVVVSYYYFMTKYVIEDQLFSGTMEDYCQLFIDDLIFYGPWWKHVKEAWDRREEGNILVLFYEDMQQDLRKAVLDVATFLNKPLTETQVDLIVQHCSFASMKDNKAVNYDWLKDVGAAKHNENFMRKGQVGDWKNHLSQEVIEKLDEVVATKLTSYGVPIVDTLPSKPS
ncbi:sulfotransferase 1E1-like isoform X2 [Physella acuta]|uniref:sulfotransferase 1E1-like isoform X2 n=1 Tax=Physella acuta TaxID=109671 RepID=UPI0027DD413C|nr:sulfotransferase 1E1-like isoform X2 [Physella acuta]